MVPPTTFCFLLLPLLVATRVAAAAAAATADGHDCSLKEARTSKEGCAYAAGRTGGFCDPAFRCPRADVSSTYCVPELGYGRPRPIVWGSASKDGLDGPVDLAFHPERGGCELWVLNQRGNSVTTIFNPGSTVGLDGNNPMSNSSHSRSDRRVQRSETRQDIEACHFSPTPSSLSFGGAPPEGDHPEFPGTKFLGGGGRQGSTFLVTPDTNNDYDPSYQTFRGTRYADDFMGPSLFSGNLSEFAVKNNDIFPGDLDTVPHGSHLIMIHQMPFAGGSTWAGHGTSFYLWDEGPDAFVGSVVLLDILGTHGFGGQNHTRAGLRRVVGSSIKRVPGTPGHMALDAEKKWLYICDPGNGRLVRIDTTSGRLGGDVKPMREWREPYRKGYRRWENVTIESLTFKANRTPSGIAYVDGSDGFGMRIWVSDARNGEIVLVRPPHRHGTSSSTDVPLDQWVTDDVTITTPARHIAGLTVDPELGRLWFVDKAESKLYVLEPRCVTMEGCKNNDWNGDSPWKGSCSPPPQDATRETAAKTTTTLYEALQQKNRETMGYSVQEMGGCARSFFAACHGGDEVDRPICAARGLGVSDACVRPESSTFFGTRRGATTCECMRGGTAQCSSKRYDNVRVRDDAEGRSRLATWAVVLISIGSVVVVFGVFVGAYRLGRGQRRWTGAFKVEGEEEGGGRSGRLLSVALTTASENSTE